MADEEKVKEFPDIGQKLVAPKKISAFEKERQAAEAKRLRAEAENAAALKAFEDSFADDGFYAEPPTSPRSRYDGGYSSRKRGSGTLGTFPGSSVPPPSLKRKRALDEMREQREALQEQDLIDASEGIRGESPRPQPQTEPIEDDIPKPTVQLSSLPPGTSADDVRALLQNHLCIHSIRFLPSSGPRLNHRQTIVAIVTLSSHMSANQIDTAVSMLKDKYLGCGFYLSISRHLSSAALHPTIVPNHASRSSEPFGADRPSDQQAHYSHRTAPHRRDQRGFAPPESYETPSRASHNSSTQDANVSVHPPTDLETVKAIHVIVEHLLLEPDVERALEMEAMLMALPEVQQDERFAFLYDSRSPAGIYYRFCLWTSDASNDEIQEQKRRLCGPERLFDDVAIEWLPPYTEVAFPDLKSLSQVVADVDYVSSDEESDDEDAERKFNTGREETVNNLPERKKHMTPMQHARLTHLLARLPTSIAKLRKGDIARITSFAINHAGLGAEDIVNMLLLNIEKPFAYSLAAKYEQFDDEEDEETYEPDDDLTELDPSMQHQDQIQNNDVRRDNDPSNAKLIALYAISDILSASSTAGARNAWKYRQLFEAGFMARKTFEHLGRVVKELSWGRFKAEQWRRKINVVFSIWETWSVFPAEVHEQLKQNFAGSAGVVEEKLQPEPEKMRAVLSEAPKSSHVQVGSERMISGNLDAHNPIADPDKKDFRKSSGIRIGDIQQHNDNGKMQVPLDDRAHAQQSTSVKQSNEAEDHEENLSKDAPGDQLGEKPDPIVARDPIASMTSANGSAGKPTGPRRRMRAEDMFADSDED